MKVSWMAMGCELVQTQRQNQGGPAYINVTKNINMQDTYIVCMEHILKGAIKMCLLVHTFLILLFKLKQNCVFHYMKYQTKRKLPF